MTKTKASAPRLTRRRFLVASAAAGALAGLQYGAGRYLTPFAGAGAEGNTAPLAIDSFARTVCSPNCTGACGQKAWIRDGRVVKIEQARDYADAVYNPRGCMKGLSYIQSIYGPDRVRHPFIRAGERGEQKWRQASWDEALDHIATKLREIIDQHGAESVYFFPQLPGTGPIQKGAATRLAALLGASHGTFYDFNGDLPISMPITFGVQCSDHETKDWANSRFLLLVGANPIETRIPDAHFLADATENGARIVAVDPKFSATAAMADDWLPIEPGTDGALALALVNVILREGLGDLDYMATYSDAPLLVREDTGKRLRESDLQTGGSDSRFAVWDMASNGPAVIGTDRLGLPDGVRAALSGSYGVQLADGGTVKVRPGFDYVQEAVKEYTPEAVQELTQVPADKIEKLARAFATTKPAAVIFGAGANHWYHCDLTGRAFALLSAVTGNVGRSGGGISIYVGQYKLRFDVSSWWFPEGKKPNFIPPMYMIHGPTQTMSPSIKLPKNGFKAVLVSHSNLLNQSPNLNKLLERLQNETELFVVLEFAMTPTAEYADVLLPAATWYEKMDVIATPVHPFLQLMQPAVDPQFEARTEFWIYSELAKRLDPSLAARHYDTNEEEVISTILANGGPQVAGITIDQLKSGPVRLNEPDPDVTFHDQIENLKPFPPPTYPFPLEATQKFVKTGRMEFYKEEDRFLEHGVQVPVYKPPFEADGAGAERGKYPLVLLSPHERWRVHSTYSNQPWLLEINGGRAEVSLHPTDAATRGIERGDLVEIYNGRGATQCWARVTDQVRPGTVSLYEGWWKRYFAKGGGVNELTADLINPIHEIYFLPNVWSPVTPWKEALCDVRKV
jgi:anaerobic selenocysteine-containing dehydrogenase